MAIESPEEYLAGEILIRSLRLNRLTASERAALFEILKRMEEDLIDELQSRDLTEIGRRDRAALLRQAQDIISQHYGEISDHVADTLTGLGRAEADVMTKALQTAFGVSYTPSLPTEGYFKSLLSNTLIEGAPSADWWDRQSGDMQFRFANAVRQGLAQAETNDQIIKRVRGTDGLMGIARRNVAAMVQTSVQQVASDARRATFAENDDIVKGIRQNSVMDSHTSERCIAYSGAEWENNEERTPIAPNKLPYNGGVPRHWNAVCAGEMVRTSTGMKPIEAIAVGDLVFTHAGRFKPVTAVMRKRNESGFIRVINLDSGRIIRVTDEHPVLALELGWRRADSLAIGDKLYQYRNESTPVGIWLSRDERNPQYYPSVSHAFDVFSHVLVEPGKMAMSINLNDELGRINREISDASADNDLAIEVNTSKSQSFAKQYFSKWQVVKLKTLNLFKDAIHRAFKMGRVIFCHPFGMVGKIWIGFFGEAPRPMIWATHSAFSVEFLHDHTRSFATAPDLNAMSFAPGIEASLAKPHFSLNLTDGFARTEMLTCDQVCDDSAIGKINHFRTYKISDISIVAYDGDVFNLSVEDDETYLIDDVIVHNCRSVEVPITKTYEELGIDVPEKVAGTRASSLGQISANTTMAEFIRMHDRGFVDELLGIGKADLFLSGKITLTDLVDQTGRPLTLKELQELYD